MYCTYTQMDYRSRCIHTQLWTTFLFISKQLTPY